MVSVIEKRLLDRVGELIRKGEGVLKSEWQQSIPGVNIINPHSFVNSAMFSEWRNQSLTFLNSLLGASHTYTISFTQSCSDSNPLDTERGIGILRAVHEDIQGGYLSTLQELVHAEVFSDFLEMAEYLMSEGHGYKDAAAVLAGGVLEEHLRKLCQRHGIPIETQSSSGTKPKKADSMNAELAMANIYNKNYQKIITGWLGIRNSAAHAKYDDYTKELVASLISGVRDFIAHYPA